MTASIASTKNEAQDLVPAKVASHVSQFCMDLLLMDDVLTSKEEFKQFCLRMNTILQYVQCLKEACYKDWHADMSQQALKNAARSCLFVSKYFETLCIGLGQCGRAALSLKLHDKHDGFPYCAQLVWAYVDWKLAHDTSCNKRTKGIISPGDDIFTPENVARNKTLQCAVNIGVEAMILLRTPNKS